MRVVPGIRGAGFSRVSLDRPTPSLPCPKDGDWPSPPPTEDEWKWVMENTKLFVFAARKYGGRVARMASRGDVVNFAIPHVIRAKRMWRADGGRKLSAWVIQMLRNAFSNARWRQYPGPGRPGNARRPPILLGVYEPEGPEIHDREREPDPDIVAAVRFAMRSLDLRRQESLSRWLGLDGERESTETITDGMGISRTRLYQLLSTALEKLRAAIGLERKPDHRLLTEYEKATMNRMRARKAGWWRRKQKAKSDLPS